MTSFMEDKEDAAWCAAKSPKMNWSELKDYALNFENKCGRFAVMEDFFQLNNICFFKNGNVLTDERAFIASNRTPAQMLIIINTLFEENQNNGKQ